MSSENVTYDLNFPHHCPTPTQAQFEEWIRLISYNGGSADEFFAQLDGKPHQETCHITTTRSKNRSGERGVWVYELSCGHVAETVDVWPPDFCSYCGARIVSGE